jgi:hypothetical protein
MSLECCLCGHAAKQIGVFSPNENFARRIGQRSGKQRIVMYGLCESCLRLPDRNARVEQAMLDDLQVH